jgi:vacuole morphology and inheritance protein 14
VSRPVNRFLDFADALNQDLARYLDEIVPPVLACFTDQDARVRYYACESMYNIAKVAKGEVLPYFNDIFDALCKVSVFVLSWSR